MNASRYIDITCDSRLETEITFNKLFGAKLNGSPLFVGYLFQKISISTQYFATVYQNYRLDSETIVLLNKQNKLKVLFVSNMPSDITKEEIKRLSPKFIQDVVFEMHKGCK